MHKLILPFIAVLVFAFGFFITRDTLSRIYSDIKSGGVKIGEAVILDGKCNSDCQKEIADQVARAVATLSATPEGTSSKQTSVATKNDGNQQSSKFQDMYIQISGDGSTQNTSWTDVVGTDFSFDVTSDFEKGANFAWEAFLKIDNANGTAFARIYDVTHGIGIDGSEMSVNNKGDFTRVNSTNMNFWSGRNTYRVQIKSLNTLKVYYMGGKVRVSY